MHGKYGVRDAKGVRRKCTCGMFVMYGEYRVRARQGACREKCTCKIFVIYRESGVRELQRRAEKSGVPEWL
jgi:hypothetical protein